VGDAADASAGTDDEGRVPDRRQSRASALAAIAVPVGVAERNHQARLERVNARRRKPAARRRREWVEMAVWFAVGGAGGLAALVLIRGTEAVLAWR
jgi:hypothetical protein